MPDVMCDSELFIDSLNYAVLPGLVLWVGILPLLALVMLTSTVHRIYYPSSNESVKEQASRVRNTKYFYGFFIVGLKNGLTN